MFCLGGFCLGGFWQGGFCPGGFCLGVYVWGVFVWGVFVLEPEAFHFGDFEIRDGNCTTEVRVSP